MNSKMDWQEAMQYKKKEKKKNWRKMDSTSENGTTRTTDIGAVGVLEGEKKEKEQGKIWNK